MSCNTTGAAQALRREKKYEKEFRVMVHGDPLGPTAATRVKTQTAGQ